MSDLKSRLEQVYESLTPGAIERADLDGMAFTVRDAISELERFRSERNYVVGCNDGYAAAQSHFAGALETADADKAALAGAVRLATSDAAYHLSKYRPHVLNALRTALASVEGRS